MFLPFKPLVTTVVLESDRATVANPVSDRISTTLRNSKFNVLIIMSF
ncbi:MAG: hypothetical protein KAF91_12555 [Nostoc sp. TH1S01]|nr:hypothetical protein [Nostoc sp. TH1S01]